MVVGDPPTTNQRDSTGLSDRKGTPIGPTPLFDFIRQDALHGCYAAFFEVARRRDLEAQRSFDGNARGLLTAQPCCPTTGVVISAMPLNTVLPAMALNTSLFESRYLHPFFDTRQPVEVCGK